MDRDSSDIRVISVFVPENRKGSPTMVARDHVDAVMNHSLDINPASWLFTFKAECDTDKRTGLVETVLLQMCHHVLDRLWGKFTRSYLNFAGILQSGGINKERVRAE